MGACVIHSDSPCDAAGVKTSIDFSMDDKDSEESADDDDDDAATVRHPPTHHHHPLCMCLGDMICSHSPTRPCAHQHTCVHIYSLILTYITMHAAGGGGGGRGTAEARRVLSQWQQQQAQAGGGREQRR
jgi:hypothetical protein